MRPLTLVLTTTALAVVIALPQSALAACSVTTSTPTYKTTVGSRTFYVVTLGCGTDLCPFAEFVYQEANNMPGLQRHDATRDDTCGNSALADIQIW